MPPNPHWRMTGQRHTHHEMIVVYRGSETVTMGSTCIVAKAGDVLLYPRGLDHDEVSDPRNPVETVCIAFTGGVSRDFSQVSDSGGRIRALARWLVDANFLTYPDIHRLRSSYLNVILEEFGRLKTVPRENEIVRSVRAYIYSNMGRHIAVDALAAEANMNKFHFIRKYRSLSGRTPMDDVWAIRLASARSLVTDTSLALRTIAGMSGFANEYHFARRFKAQFGVTPGSLRTRGRVAAY